MGTTLVFGKNMAAMLRHTASVGLTFLRIMGSMLIWQGAESGILQAFLKNMAAILLKKPSVSAKIMC